jgi:hypothetical protein
MPITPFYSEPRALVHASAPSRLVFYHSVRPLCWLALSLYIIGILSNNRYISATVVLFGAVIIFATTLTLASALPMLFPCKQLSHSSGVIGAILGASSHTSIRLNDIFPLLPFSSRNALFPLISMSSLQIMGLGLAGLLIFGLRKACTQRGPSC